jgi:hypothetical protein
MNLLCKIFGHKWICYLGYGSICKRCGIKYGEDTKEQKE